ncbi:hypothetical protein MXD61_01790 [Frankia sp. AgPm24]|uniref:Uncharacterized protein n=1 Tax=Frankia umida TaxID=573489 RepID=A0ABT0JUE5_9ACTN|nr:MULTISPECIES: hypothetical protein [Frankia]MCK9875174.1 hypothetical protein [Frankia umida]MCK9920652.1 hypothetical protein [Frankia sp. AgPm24]
MANEQAGFDGVAVDEIIVPGAEDLWSDVEEEEIVGIARTCAYDPLTRL